MIDIAARLRERLAQLNAAEQHAAYLRGQVAELEAIIAELQSSPPDPGPAAAEPEPEPDGAE